MQHIMSRGLGKVQQEILNFLSKKEGRATTNILMEQMGIGTIRSGKVSFWRAMVGLEKKELIYWDRGAGTTSGLVCVKRINVLLVDIDDTKAANLALMKVSSYHKRLGHNVYLQRGLITNTMDKPDIVYIFCIFTWGRPAARKLAKQFHSQGIEKIHIGGTGVNLTTTLPEEIEHLMPDYSIYPDCCYSLGYTSRGCIRNCEFCVVPKKEGKIRATNDIYEFYDRRFKHIEILDNNPMALPAHFKKIAGQILKENLTVNFHGLDIRILNDDNAEILSKLKVKPAPHFAWDNMEDEYAVMRGIEILRRNGIRLSVFYVLVGFNTTFEEDLYRLEKLKSVGQLGYVMRYDTTHKDMRYNDLAAWANQPAFFRKKSFNEFSKERHENRSAQHIVN
jgi:hypothetical protein